MILRTRSAKKTRQANNLQVPPELLDNNSTEKQIIEAILFLNNVASSRVFPDIKRPQIYDNIKLSYLNKIFNDAYNGDISKVFKTLNDMDNVTEDTYYTLCNLVIDATKEYIED